MRADGIFYPRGKNIPQHRDLILGIKYTYLCNVECCSLHYNLFSDPLTIFLTCHLTIGSTRAVCANCLYSKLYGTCKSLTLINLLIILQSLSSTNNVEPVHDQAQVNDQK